MIMVWQCTIGGTGFTRLVGNFQYYMFLDHGNIKKKKNQKWSSLLTCCISQDTRDLGKCESKTALLQTDKAVDIMKRAQLTALEKVTRKNALVQGSICSKCDTMKTIVISTLKGGVRQTSYA